jgi:hypothetical protein
MTERHGKGAVAVAAVLLLAACGGGGDGGGDGGDGGGKQPVGAGSDLGEAGDLGVAFDIDRLCSMLDEDEIAAEFGERGPVGPGTPDFTHCVWDVGDEVAAFSLSYTQPTPGQTDEETFADMRDFVEADPTAEVTDAPGLGDEAYFEEVPDQTFLHFRSGGVSFIVSTFFVPPVEGTHDKLATLAGHVLDRV